MCKNKDGIHSFTSDFKKMCSIIFFMTNKFVSVSVVSECGLLYII